MRRDSSLAVTATVTLAIAIGAATTVFSLVDSILLRPLPFRDPAHVYWLSERMGRTPVEQGVGADYYSLRERKQVFSEVGAFDTLTVNWPGVDRPEPLDCAIATPSFFGVLDTRPLMGRTFDEAEQGQKVTPVVILSYAFWSTRLNRDPAVLTRTLTLDDVPHRVIGVMPQGFDYPKGTQVWRPMGMSERGQRPRSGTRPMQVVRMIARLRPELDERQMQATLPTLTRSLLVEYPPDFANTGFLDNFTVLAEPLQRRLTGDVRPALYALSCAVLLVLLIACANLANLLLARAAARQREFAVRLALGADRARLTRQLLLESCRLALPGGVAGAALAALAVRFLNVAQPLALVQYPKIVLDLRTLGFTFALTLATALVFGMAPVFAAGKVDLQEALKAGGHGNSGSRAARSARRVLVAGELAVSLILLIGAGLMARSFLNLARVHLGFRAERLLTMRVNLTGPRYDGGAQQQAYYRDALSGITSLPGVRAAAVSTDLPLSSERSYQSFGFQIAGRAPLPMAQRPQTDVGIVSTDYFAAMGMAVQAGRVFDASDNERSPNALVINQVLARKVFPGEDPLGHVMVTGQAGRESRWTIVGVVSDIRGSELGAEPGFLVYRCLCQQSKNPFLWRMAMIVRTTGDPLALARAVTTRMYAVDATQPVFDVKTMEQRVSATLAPERFQLWLIGVFAAIAIVLAAVGVYGVMAYLVTQRTREIGIRIAVGARPVQVHRLVLGETAMLALTGTAVGIAGAWGLTRYLKAMLYGVTALDGATFAVACLALFAVALAAALTPARRAGKVDPLTALRHE